MTKKLLIVMATANPQNPAEIFAPLSQASVAAAMGYEVEVILTGCSGELVQPGRAAEVPIPGVPGATAYSMIQEACQAGVIFKVCSPMLAIWGETLIPEVTEVIGAAYVISESMEGDAVIFTY